MYKELLQLNKNNKTNNQVKKWAKDLNRYFTEEGIQIVTKHIKGCLMVLNYTLKSG